jgi:hypothetical protein
VIAKIPASQVAAVSRELTRRREYVTMGRFVGYLSDDSIRAALGAMDTLTLLNVAFVLENKDRLPEIVEMLDPGRLEEMIALAASSDLAEEALQLLDSLTEAQRARVMAMPELQHYRRAS